MPMKFLDEAAGSGVVKIAGNKFAVGLLWVPSDTPSSIVKDAKAKACEDGIKADLYCTRPLASQFGLAWRESGHGKGLPSLAAAVADAVGSTSWIGAFEIGGRWWFGLANDDTIGAEGDCLYENESDAMRRLEEENSIGGESGGGYPRIFAPPHWGLERSDPSTIDTVIADVELVPLRPVASFLGFSRADAQPDLDEAGEDGQEPGRRKIPMLAVLGAVSVIGAGGAGLWWYQSEQEAERARIESERLAAIARHQAQQANASTENPIPSAGQPSARDWLLACRDTLKTLSIVVPGWDIERIACDRAAGATAGWRRRGGMVEDFRVKAQTVALPFIDTLGGQASLSLAIPAGPKRQAETLWNRLEIKEQLWDRPARIGGEINVTDPPPPQPPVPPRPGEPPPPPPPIRFELKASIPFADWAYVLNDIPGLIIESVTWSSQAEAWHIKGGVYERQANPGN